MALLLYLSVSLEIEVLSYATSEISYNDIRIEVSINFSLSPLMLRAPGMEMSLAHTVTSQGHNTHNQTEAQFSSCMFKRYEATQKHLQ